MNIILTHSLRHQNYYLMITVQSFVMETQDQLKHELGRAFNFRGFVSRRLCVQVYV